MVRENEYKAFARGIVAQQKTPSGIRMAKVAWFLTGALTGMLVTLQI